MATLRHILNGVVLGPELPVESELEPLGDEQQMAGGNSRFWHRADKLRVTLRRRNLSEAELATWEAASPLNAAVSYVDERNVTRTVRVVRRKLVLTRTRPVDNAAFYTAEIELREL